MPIYPVTTYNTVSAGAANLITMQGIGCHDSRKTKDEKQARNKGRRKPYDKCIILIPNGDMGQANKKKGSEKRANSAT
jgi:hypothetical protein